MSTVNIDIIDRVCWLTNLICLKTVRSHKDYMLEVNLSAYIEFFSQFYFMPVQRSSAAH
jgi:hypothetical protein